MLYRVFFVVWLAIFPNLARSETVAVDASKAGVNAGLMTYCCQEFYTGLLTFHVGDKLHAGDVLSFGTITLTPFASSGHSLILSEIDPGWSFYTTPSEPLQSFPFSVNDDNSCALTYDNGFSCSLPRPLGKPTIEKITYVVPNHDFSIGLLWGGPSVYTPPVPEPATWVLVIVGFAGVGLFISRAKLTLKKRALTFGQGLGGPGNLR